MNIDEIIKQRIEFPETFFQDEIREGFLVKGKMKRAWAAQMEVLKEIDRICEQYGIPYFADSGTLLGAVRHKGFIPWDDDVDIAMVRDDYERFCQIIGQEIPEGWAFSDWNEEGGLYAFGRVINGRAYDTRTERMIQFHGCPYVVGVDIFPLDFVPPEKEEEEAWHLLLKYLYSVLCEVQKSKIDNATTEQAMLLEQYLKQAEEWCKVTLDRKKDIERQVMQLMEKIARLYKRSEAKELEMVVYDWQLDKKYKYKREWYEERIKVPFENIMIPIPVGYAEVLNTMFGEDYMTPKRVQTPGHEYPFYIKQDILLEKMRKRVLG